MMVRCSQGSTDVYDYVDSCIKISRYCVVVLFFKQKTAYEMRISDWSSDVCSSDLLQAGDGDDVAGAGLLDVLAVIGVHLQHAADAQIGRASCRERVCQYV